MKRFITLTFIMLASITVRICFTGIYADSFDAVDFALGVTDFDVYAMQPHFPGYPVLMVGASIVNQWIMDPVLTLSMISSVSGGLLSLPVYWIAKRMFDSNAGLIAAGLVALNPLLWLYSLQPMSDMPGILFVFTSMACLVQAIYAEKGSLRQWTFSAGAVALFGLAMGIRLSYFPFAAAFLLLFFYLARSIKGYLFLSFIGFFFLALWILPTAWHEGGLQRYIEMGMSFTQGHFTEWGGTALDSQLSTLKRIEIMLGNYLLVMGGAGWLKGIDYRVWIWLITGLFMIGFCKYRKSELVILSLMMMPYLIWSVLGQNADKPRHMLVLIPFLLIMVTGLIIPILKRRSSLIMAGLCFILLWYGWNGWNWSDEYHRSVPPTVQLAQYMEQHYDPRHSIVYTWEEERVIEYYNPAQQAERLKSPSYFENRMLMQANLNMKILVTHHVLDGFGEKKAEFMPHFRQVARFQGNSVFYPVYHEIVLYEAQPSLLPYLKTRD